MMLDVAMLIVFAGLLACNLLILIATWRRRPPHEIFLDNYRAAIEAAVRRTAPR